MQVTLDHCPIPNAKGTLTPEGTGANKVLLLGEALGEAEAMDGLPFRPYAPAGSVLERAIRRAGYNRDQFVVWNVVPTQPPKNWLDGAPYEVDAIEWGRPYLEQVIERYQPQCIVALGSIPIRATTGLCGSKLGVSSLCGFILPSRYNIPVVASFHPSFLRRGAMGLFGTMVRCLKLGVKVAHDRMQAQTPPVDAPPRGYIMHPGVDEANNFLCAIKSGAYPYLAYDIETPYSTEEDTAEDADAHDARTIKSIQFSLTPNSGIFMPWREPYITMARTALAHPIPKLGWNIWRFDDPILRDNHAPIAGESHDLMWAWHHLQPDLPRGLQFAAAQQGWPWPWKHLSDAHPAFYGIVDVACLQWMI